MRMFSLFNEKIRKLNNMMFSIANYILKNGFNSCIAYMLDIKRNKF